MPDLSSVLMLVGIVVGLVALSVTATATYHRTRHEAVAAALRWLLDAAADPDARDLDKALAHADTVLGRRTS
ncbi:MULTISPECIES: hypothetical protein [unclassified Nonomuraea]|uniref:hypothetical protein n=1 Tax=unclassified Nonomuraea TaxID=2593643 RepID=UPI00340F7585